MIKNIIDGESVEFNMELYSFRLFIIIVYKFIKMDKFYWVGFVVWFFYLIVIYSKVLINKI